MVNDFPLRNEIVKILCHRNNKYKGSSSAKKKVNTVKRIEGEVCFLQNLHGHKRFCVIHLLITFNHR